MQGLKGLLESTASVFANLYNNTLPVGIILSSLQQEDVSFADLLSPTLNFIVGLSVITGCLLLYYFLWLPINRVKDLYDVGYSHIESSRKGRKSKKDLVKEVRRRRLLGDMPPVYPNGWFAILESTDVKPGQVKHVKALGENFAVMRNSEGVVRVLDAYCPHLGANMAVGGVVRGDCLECPFHGWQFRGEDGTCAHIPYSDKVPKTAVVRKWACKEVNHMVFVWYHAEGEPPSWQVESIPEVETGRFWYRGRTENYTNAHIQDVGENIAEISHFSVTHAAFVTTGSHVSNHGLIHSILRHVYSGDYEQHSKTGEEHMCTLSIDHSIRLFNMTTLPPKHLTSTLIGPAYIVTRINGSFYFVYTMTPIEPFLVRLVFRFYSAPLLFVYSGIILYGSVEMLERDIVVWNHKKHEKKPAIIKEDEAIARHRRWFSQFYTDSSVRFPFQRESLEW